MAMVLCLATVSILGSSCSQFSAIPTRDVANDSLLLSEYGSPVGWKEIDYYNSALYKVKNVMEKDEVSLEILEGLRQKLADNLHERSTHFELINQLFTKKLKAQFGKDCDGSESCEQLLKEISAKLDEQSNKKMMGLESSYVNLTSLSKPLDLLISELSKAKSNTELQGVWSISKKNLRQAVISNLEEPLKVVKALSDFTQPRGLFTNRDANINHFLTYIFGTTDINFIQRPVIQKIKINERFSFEVNNSLDIVMLTNHAVIDDSCKKFKEDDILDTLSINLSKIEKDSKKMRDYISQESELKLKCLRGIDKTTYNAKNNTVTAAIYHVSGFRSDRDLIFTYDSRDYLLNLF
jgi:hypothetical protein